MKVKNAHPAVDNPRANAKRRERRVRLEEVRATVTRVLARERGTGAPRLLIGGEKMPGDRTLSGKAASFDNADYGGDIIAAGAFDSWLRWYQGAAVRPPPTWRPRQGEPLPLRAEHGEGVLGHAERLWTDDDGLYGTFRLLPATGERVFRQVRAGAWDGLSIGYFVRASRPATWEERELGAENVLTDVWVEEISLVKFPANTLARVYAVKSRAQMVVDSVRQHLAAQTYGACDPAYQAAVSGRVRRTLARARRPAP